MANTAVVIVDDFYLDPASVRNVALEMTYADAAPDAERASHGGKLSQAVPALAQLGMEILSEQLRAVTTWSKPHGEFRLVFAPEADPHAPQPWIQLEPLATRYSALVFLHPPEQRSGGIALYRHRELGIERLPQPGSREAAELVQRTGVAWPQLLARLVEDGHDIAGKWDEVGHVAMRFNRCVVLDGSLFHACTAGFGTTKDTARLIQHFDFDIVEPQRPIMPIPAMIHPAPIALGYHHV